MKFLLLYLQGLLLLGMSGLLKGQGLGKSHGKPLAKPQLKVMWKLNLSILLVGDHTFLHPMVLKLFRVTNRFVKAMPDSVILTVCRAFKMK